MNDGCRAVTVSEKVAVAGVPPGQLTTIEYVPAGVDVVVKIAMAWVNVGVPLKVKGVALRPVAAGTVTEQLTDVGVPVTRVTVAVVDTPNP